MSKNVMPVKVRLFIPNLFLSCVLAVLFVLGLSSCSKSPDSTQSFALDSPLSKDLVEQATEYVLLIDNSKSIKPAEQLMILESTLLLADLVDPGDRISVITFGKDARIAISKQLLSNQDRQVFKASIKERVKFDENFSDITSGITLLASQQQSLFPTSTAKHAALLFSDGKLEPADRKVDDAYQRLRTTIHEALESLAFYAVVLGDTSSAQMIPGLTITGNTLMKKEIARQPQFFFHAKQLDQVLDTTITFLKDTKGMASLEDEHDNAFRIDQTVESMTFIVRKRTVDGEVLAESSQIQLESPTESSQPGKSSEAPESIHRSNDYQYFDLFVVRNPRPGIWKLTLSNGYQPQVLSTINSPIALKVTAKQVYFFNEVSPLQAWLIDTKHAQLSSEPYQVQAHLLETTQGDDKNEVVNTIYIPLLRDEKSSQYYLSLPSMLVDRLPSGQKPEIVRLEIIAQKIVDSTTGAVDPWFLRRSPVISMTFADSWIHWAEVDHSVQRIPHSVYQADFGATLDTDSVYFQAFDVPPKLNLNIERWDKETESFQPYHSATTDVQTLNNQLRFSLPQSLTDYGEYRYNYQLSGTTKEGMQTLKSPWYYLSIQIPWLIIGTTFVTLLIVMNWIASATAKLRGQMQIQADSNPPQFETIRIRPRRFFDSRDIKDVELGSMRFKIEAKRYGFLIKRLHVCVLSGTATIDHSQLEKGRTHSVRTRGSHRLKFIHDAGYDIEVTFTLHI